MTFGEGKTTPQGRTPRVPTLTLHKRTGQGYVRMNGRCYYLGRYGEPETEARYHQRIAEWMARGRQLPVAQDVATVLEVCARFWRHAESYYRRPDGAASNELHQFKLALKPLKLLYGMTLAAEFGPLALRVVRENMIAGGWCRRHVNHNIGRIKRMFRWATENELLPGNVYHALDTVGGLRRGRCSARESLGVKPAPQELIEAVKPYVSEQVWAMIRLQRFTAARAGELAIMRPCDVDRDGKVWMYTPSDHKTAHYGYQRRIYIGPQGQEILGKFLVRPPGSYCFSPVEAEVKRHAEMHERRETPLSCGNRPGTNRVARPRKKPGTRYTTQSYGRAIAYACQRAFPLPEHLGPRRLENGKRESAEAWRDRLTEAENAEIKVWRKAHHWHPHQLRHNAATELRKEFGLEAARIILGHRSAAITEVYAELDQTKAFEAIVKYG